MTILNRAACTDYFGFLNWDEVVEHSKRNPLLLFHSPVIVVGDPIPVMVAYADEHGLTFGEVYSKSSVKNYLKKKRIWFSGCWIVERGEVVEYQKRECGLFDYYFAASTLCVRQCVDKYSAKRGIHQRRPPTHEVLPRERLRRIIRTFDNSAGHWSEFDQLVKAICAGDSNDVERLIDALTLLEHRLQAPGLPNDSVQWIHECTDQINAALYRITKRPKGWFTSVASRAWLMWWREHEKEAHHHEWERYRCKSCGATRPEEVTIPTWDPVQSALLEHKYLAENLCLCGGSWQIVTHSSPIPSGTSETICKCSRCGAKQVFLFRIHQSAPESSRSEKSIESQEIFESISGGDLPIVNYLLEQDPNLVGARGPKGITPLHMASMRCQQSVARLLLEKGADVNARKDDGWTPLHHSSQNGDLALVTLLLDHGADPNLRSQGGQTALHTAAYGMTEMTMRTLEKEWAVTDRQNRPIIDSESVVRLLITRGANINATESQHGATALHLAIFRGQRAAVRGLLDRGSDLNVRVRGSTPLHIAAGRCDEEIIRMLLEKGADINASDDNGRIAREVIGLSSESCDSMVKSSLEKLLSPSK